MGFKKGKPAKKSKKSSKKGGKERIWENEGGVVFDDNREKRDIPDESSGPRKRRETQDRDERFRRGKLKIEYRKLEKDIKNKWSKKISFADILNEGQSIDEAESSSNQKIRRDPFIKSTKSVCERLQLLVQKSTVGIASTGADSSIQVKRTKKADEEREGEQEELSDDEMQDSASDIEGKNDTEDDSDGDRSIALGSYLICAIFRYPSLLTNSPMQMMIQLLRRSRKEPASLNAHSGFSTPPPSPKKSKSSRGNLFNLVIKFITRYRPVSRSM